MFDKTSLKTVLPAALAGGALLLTSDAALAQAATTLVTEFTGTLTGVGADVTTLFKGIAGVVAIIVTGLILLSVFRGSAR